jgi:hypothetical protein
MYTRVFSAALVLCACLTTVAQAATLCVKPREERLLCHYQCRR